MVWAEEEVVIARPCATVFDVLTDLPQMPAWRRTLLEAVWGDDGSAGVGRSMHAVTKVAGRRFVWSCEVTDWEPPAVFGYVARGVGGNRQEVDVTFRLTSEGDGCRVRMAGGAELPGRVAGLASPVLVRLLLRENRIALQRLKLLVERSTAP